MTEKNRDIMKGDTSPITHKSHDTFLRLWAEKKETRTFGPHELKVLSFDEWSYMPADNHFTLRMEILEGDITYNAISGCMKEEDAEALIALRKKIFKQLGIKQRYTIIDALNLEGITMKARKIINYDYLVEDRNIHLAAVMASPITRLIFKYIYILAAKKYNQWHFIDSQESAYELIRQHRTGTLRKKRSQMPPELPANQEELEAFTLNLLREREKERKIRKLMLQHLFSIIGRISWDDSLEPVDKYIRKNSDFNDIFGAMKILQDDFRLMLKEREKLVDQLQTKIVNLQKKDKVLKESENKYRSLFNSISEPIFIFQAGTCKFLDCNHAFLEKYGYSKKELAKLKPSDLHPPENREAAFARFESQAPPDYSGQFVHMAKDGTRIDVDMLSNEILYEGAPAYLIVARDITERIRTEMKLKRARKEAENANLAKSHFLANMSHEIRTPMNGIIGMTDLLLTSELQPQQREYLSMVKISAESLLDIINDILDISKIEAGKMTLDHQRFNLILPIEKVMDTFATKAHEKMVDLSYDVDPAVPVQLLGDEGRLRQILINLVGNAIKFTQEGKIKVSVSPAPEQPTHLPRGNEKVALLFSVTDTGIGIPKDKLKAIFDSFTQADGTLTRDFGGTGLGLTISKQLIELMGGNISVESTIGQGSRFYFTIPLEKDREAHHHPILHAHPTLPAMDDHNKPPKEIKNIDILLAEDNPINEKLIVSLLKKKGWNAVTANNGKKALEILETNDNQFQLILMDIQMPEMDGVAVTRQIRKLEKWKEIPIIALTAHALKGDKEEFLKAGMTDYLSKPINFHSLYQMIEKYV